MKIREHHGASDKPNILIIMSDQHNAESLCWNNHDVITPSLDRLRKDSVTFSNAYCSNPLCVPSRLSFMAGLDTQKLEVWSLNDTIKPSQATWPVMLRANGYETVMSGRMHAIWGDRCLGFERRLCGDEDFYFTSGENRPIWGTPEQKSLMAPQAIYSLVGQGKHPCIEDDETACSHAEKYLEYYDGEKPFALCVGFFQPHPPFAAREKYFERYKDLPVHLEPFDESLPEFIKEHANNRGFRQDVPLENLKNAVRAYYGMVSQVDEYVGRLIKKLQKERLYDNTLIMYTSDHGEMLGKRGLWHKQCLLESSVKVPLIIKFPGYKPGKTGKSYAQCVSLLDIYPTLCQAVGEKVYDWLDGVSLYNLNGLNDRTVFAEYAAFGLQAPRAMVRKDNLKLIACRGFDAVLYNLENDPEEKKNLYCDPKYKDARKRLEKVLYKRWSPDQTYTKVRRNQLNIDVWNNALM